MKKILVTLLVAALCAPAMAATVAISDNTDGTGAIVVTAAGDAIVGLGLDIAVSGAQITAVSISPATFNIYPDAAYDLETAVPGSYTYGAGSPIALIAGPGEGSLPSSSFAISAGMLNGAAAPGADGAAVVTIDVETDLTPGNSCTVTVTENAQRGGIVLTDGANDAGSGSGDITFLSSDCITSSHEDWTDWNSVGKPSNWCWDRQCHGDGDNATEPFGRGSVWVGYNDLDVLLDAFRVGSPTEAQLAADFNRRSEAFGRGSVRVGYDDLNVLLGYFRASSVPADCLSDDHVNP